VVDVALSSFLIQIILIFILAGLVKGIVGFGLPTIGIGLGALISDIPTAMMLILVPTIFTNIAHSVGYWVDSVCVQENLGVSVRSGDVDPAWTLGGCNRSRVSF